MNPGRRTQLSSAAGTHLLHGSDDDVAVVAEGRRGKSGDVDKGRRGGGMHEITCMQGATPCLRHPLRASRFSTLLEGMAVLFVT